MALLNTDDGLIVTQEGSCARARCGRLNFLFRDRSTGAVLKEYRESVSRVRSRLRPRCEGIPSGEITPGEFADLTQEIALPWMYFYVVNRMAVDVKDADIDHPQTKHIIWSFLCRKYGETSPELLRIASELAAMTLQGSSGGWKDGKDFWIDDAER